MRFLLLGLLLACRSDHTAPARLQPRTWARPPDPPALPSTAQLWSAAEAAHSAEAWDAAAQAYERERAQCRRACADAAFAVVLARKNAVLASKLVPPPGDDPVPVPPRVQAMVDAIDRYIAIADPTDPDVTALEFIAGSTLARWRQADSIERLEEVLRDHRDHETAEYSANIVLDLLLRTGRTAEAKALVDELLADPAFLARHPDLRDTLERLIARLG